LVSGHPIKNHSKICTNLIQALKLPNVHPYHMLGLMIEIREGREEN